jgi:hypothetical protein
MEEDRLALSAFCLKLELSASADEVFGYMEEESVDAYIRKHSPREQMSSSIKGIESRNQTQREDMRRTSVFESRTLPDPDPVRQLDLILFLSLYISQLRTSLAKTYRCARYRLSSYTARTAS